LPDPSDPVHRAGIILDALYAGADTAQASRLAEMVPDRFPPPSEATPWESILEQYAGAQYRFALGRPEAAQEAVRSWRGIFSPGDTSWALQLASHLSLVLDAQLAASQHRSDALARLRTLDSVLLTGPTYGGWPSGRRFGGFEPIGNLIAARLWYERGEPARALATVRRREGAAWHTIHLSQVRDEARYAALIGDREGALRAYRHYLALRAKPEPALQSQVEAVRAEFQALLSEPDR
jgi:hypothetical protein